VPVFNTSEISSVFGGDDGASLRRDESGLVRELEFIALPETAFRLREKILREGTTVYKVETRDYPYHSKNGFFTDSRFFELKKSRPPERARHLPETAKVIQRLLDAEGTGYLWGGNFRGGVPEMLEYYPPAGPLEAEDEAAWSLEGLDCSGLLYEATGGYTPRNARGLVRFGRAVPVQGLDAAAIRGLLEPLDLIVWDTHVIIVLDDERTIQSRLEYKCDRHRPGVRVRPLRLELEELLADCSIAVYYLLFYCSKRPARPPAFGGQSR
jgi:cell wall-associated NlpC family hydrolase